MKKIVLLLMLAATVTIVKSQDHAWAFGFYGDVKFESPAYNGTFGIQGKYDFATRSAVQAQVYGRNGLVAVGADYLFSILDKTKSNFNVFLGAGLSQDFYRYDSVLENTAVIPVERENYAVSNAQDSDRYYLPTVILSVYPVYKAKYQSKWQDVNPNSLMLGDR